jgi:hypothetical protein
MYLEQNRIRKPYKQRKSAYIYFCEEKLNNELKDLKDPK